MQNLAPCGLRTSISVEFSSAGVLGIAMEFPEVPAARKTVNKSGVHVSAKSIPWQSGGLDPCSGPNIPSVDSFTYNPPRQCEQFGAGSQVRFVDSYKIHFKLQQVILERETQHSSDAQEVRSLADRQDPCSLDDFENLGVSLRFRVADK
jgi:hypothetical protein